MPSVAHEAPIELIRQCPPLALELVRAMTVDGRDQTEPLPEQVDVSLGPTDLTDVVPAQYLADAVVVVSDAATGAAVMVIIIEPQGRDDPTKEFSWPVYLTAVRRATACRRAYLLVVCPNPAEAEKCRQVIRIGQPGFNLVPTVIDPLNTPGTGDASPYLAIFASCMGAINLEEDQGARHVLAAIRDTGASTADRERLITIILTLASDAARQLLEAMMTTIEWKSDFIENFRREGIREGIKEGIQEGIKEGIREGIKEGIKKGIEEGKAEYVLRTLDVRGIKVTEKQHEQVISCADPAQLDRWFDRALTAKSAADVFQD